jgi:hypothetical protein
MTMETNGGDDRPTTLIANANANPAWHEHGISQTQEHTHMHTNGNDGARTRAVHMSTSEGGWMRGQGREGECW